MLVSPALQRGVRATQKYSRSPVGTALTFRIPTPNLSEIEWNPVFLLHRTHPAQRSRPNSIMMPSPVIRKADPIEKKRFRNSKSNYPPFLSFSPSRFHPHGIHRCRPNPTRKLILRPQEHILFFRRLLQRFQPHFDGTGNTVSKSCPSPSTATRSRLTAAQLPTSTTTVSPQSPSHM